MTFLIEIKNLDVIDFNNWLEFCHTKVWICNYELMHFGNLSVDQFQTSEYGGEQFSAEQNSANLWKIAEIITELVTADSIHKIFNLAIDEFIFTLRLH